MVLSFRFLYICKLKLTTMSLSKKINFILVLCISIQSFSQDKVQELDSIVINSSRISLPFKKNSRTITIIKAKDIKNSAAPIFMHTVSCKMTTHLGFIAKYLVQLHFYEKI